MAIIESNYMILSKLIFYSMLQNNQYVMMDSDSLKLKTTKNKANVGEMDDFLQSLTDADILKYMVFLKGIHIVANISNESLN